MFKLLCVSFLTGALFFISRQKLNIFEANQTESLNVTLSHQANESIRSWSLPVRVNTTTSILNKEVLKNSTITLSPSENQEIGHSSHSKLRISSIFARLSRFALTIGPFLVAFVVYLTLKICQVVNLWCTSRRAVILDPQRFQRPNSSLDQGVITVRKMSV